MQPARPEDRPEATRDARSDLSDLSGWGTQPSMRPIHVVVNRRVAEHGVDHSSERAQSTGQGGPQLVPQRRPRISATRRRMTDAADWVTRHASSVGLALAVGGMLTVIGAIAMILLSTHLTVQAIGIGLAIAGVAKGICAGLLLAEQHPRLPLR